MIRAVTTLLHTLLGIVPRRLVVLAGAIIGAVSVLSALIAVLTYLEVIPPTLSGDSDEESSFTELAQDFRSLLVEVSVDPLATHLAPLEDVDLTAILPPTTEGEITYLFDCTADGTPEMSLTSVTSRASAVDVCDYPAPGTYVARVQAVTTSTTYEAFVGIVVDSRSLFVNGLALPSQGTAPLTDVDLVAVVTGTMTGDIQYWFDCTGDGIWDRQETVRGEGGTGVYVAEDLCDYPEPGLYTARIRAGREGSAFEGAHAVFVQSP
jgi:hypothetical protein